MRHVVCIILAICGLCARAAEPQDNPDVTFHVEPSPLAEGAVVGDWPWFLGPDHTGVCKETPLLKDFAGGKPTLVWESTRGSGYASPSVAGDRLIHFHRVANNVIVDCLQASTGKRFWQFKFPTAYQDRYGYNNGPRATPVIDGNRVYTYSAEGMLHCLELETGKLVWSKNVADDYKTKQDFFGNSTTPLIDGEKIFINIGAPGGPSVIALNKSDGKQLWISNGADPKWGPSYATPLIAEFHGKRLLLVFAGGESKPSTGGLIGIDPASGEVKFSFPWRSESYESVNAANPAVSGNYVFITASYETGGALLEIQPDLSCKKVWTTDELGAHFSTPLIVDDCIYGFDGRHQQNTELACLDLKTGKTLWRKLLTWSQTREINGRKMIRATTGGRAALIKADGHYLFFGESGDLLWLDLSPKGVTELAHMKPFEAPETWCPPVISKGLLYLVQNSASPDGKVARLLCFDLRGKK